MQHIVARPGAAALRAGALPPHQGARPDAARRLERRLGARRSPTSSPSTTTRRPARSCARATRMPRRSRPCARASARRGAASSRFPRAPTGKPVMVTEFGGITFAPDSDIETWGYSVSGSADGVRAAPVGARLRAARLARARGVLLHAAHGHPPGGQRPVDERRVPKLPAADIARIVRGDAGYCSPVASHALAPTDVTPRHLPGRRGPGKGRCPRSRCSATSSPAPPDRRQSDTLR